ncbi:FecR domain-containing protein [Acidisoma cellulosilytica]|uniref:FecR domain-containing protein n=1 Tax=Acidisoma cellulosilyticum TaxID=2802395 RepID=A0A963YYW6_9PROT|nr:FecR domain-containing protein [Acidisoma cellulosilyticum]MCB8879727.1 FecR domain-containing protein [Acidisoma cellulosilyticum]
MSDSPGKAPPSNVIEGDESIRGQSSGDALTSARAAALDWLLAGAQGDAFQAWLKADPANAPAFAEVARLWHDPSFLAALHGQTRKPRRRIARPVLALAASFLVVAILGWGSLRLAGLPLHWGDDYTTRIGAQQTETLADGSLLTLDTGSAVDFGVSQSERRLTLQDGRIFIAVHHAALPFRVHVSGITVQDIGTAFSVERRDGRVTVAVRQGAVAIETPNGAVRVRAGQAVSVDHGALQPVQSIDPSMTFAWLDHRLFFQNAPLGEVVADLRRYQPGWIIIARPSLADIKVSGGYDLRRPAAAILDLAKLSGASVTQVSDRLLILH